MMTGFFCYSILEQTTGLWAATYLKMFKGMDAASAAAFAGVLFLGGNPRAGSQRFLWRFVLMISK